MMPNTGAAASAAMRSFERDEVVTSGFVVTLTGLAMRPVSMTCAFGGVEVGAGPSIIGITVVIPRLEDETSPTGSGVSAGELTALTFVVAS